MELTIKLINLSIINSIFGTDKITYLWNINVWEVIVSANMDLWGAGLSLSWSPLALNNILWTAITKIGPRQGKGIRVFILGSDLKRNYNYVRKFNVVSICSPKLSWHQETVWAKNRSDQRRASVCLGDKISITWSGMFKENIKIRYILFLSNCVQDLGFNHHLMRYQHNFETARNCQIQIGYIWTIIKHIIMIKIKNVKTQENANLCTLW